MIEFDDVTKVYPDGTTAVDGLSLSIPDNAITVFVGPSGCGKTTSLRMINRMVDATSGHDPDRRAGHPQPRRRQAAPRHRLRHPARGTVPPPHGRRQRRHRAGAVRNEPARGAQPRAGAAGAGRPRPRARRPLPGAALGRPAAAGRRRPRTGGGSAGDAHGRAVLGRRRRGAPQPAAGVPAAAGGPRQDHRARHPRHRRGGQARRPGRGLRARAVGSRRWPRPRSCWPPRPTTSWPGWWAATAASAASRSSSAADVPVEPVDTAVDGLAARARRRRPAAAAGSRPTARCRPRDLDARTTCASSPTW